MKLDLPQKTIDLNMSLEIDERMKVVDEILKMKIKVKNDDVILEDYFHETFNNQETRRALDTIGYYLTKVEKDLTILSQEKIKEMNNGSKRHVTFTSMGYENQVSLGVIDEDDYTH